MKNRSDIITEAQFRKILSESVRCILNEDVESSGMKAAVNFLIQQGQTKEQAQQIFNSLRNDIPSVRLPLYTNANGREKGTYKFAIGVERMYLNGELSDGQTIMKLNKTLKLLANGHADEYDANLNNMSAQELNRRFETAAASELQNDVEDVSSEEYTPNGYTVVRIPDFETSKQYGDYTSWCVTHYENMYNSYTSDGMGLFYFFLKDGFEEIKPVKGEACPLDEYGLSMIAVSVNMDGSLNTVTCRWNHDNGGNDNIMDAKQLSRAVGMNVYSVCKPYTREELHAKGIIPFDEVQDLLDNGTPPKKIFNVMNSFREEIALVGLNNKWNYINTEGKLLSNQWFDWADDFKEGFGYIELNNKKNFINTEGKVLSNQWFDWAFSFKEGFARVELNEKRNFINTEGEILSNQWFDGVDNFKEEFARVYLNGKCNFINTEGKVLSNQWFDNTSHFKEGFAIVELNNKYNYINKEGKLLSNLWFDNATWFYEGIAIVVLNGKHYKLNQKGELINDNINETKTTKYMKQKKTITESQLKKMIVESVKSILKEGDFNNFQADCRFWLEQLKKYGSVTITFDNPEMIQERLDYFIACCHENGLNPHGGAITKDENGNFQRVFYIDKPNTISESQLRNIIAESIRKVLKENYYENDIDETSIRDQALTVITQMEHEGLPIKWRAVAERMGFRLNTLSQDDLETMKSGIELAMHDCINPQWETVNEADRHKPGYYAKYNKEHPERLERGYTKGYRDGKYSKGKKNTGLDAAIERKLAQYHDDDYEYDSI